MAPSGQPGILALLQQSKDRLRGEQEDRLKGEQEVVEAKRRKVERKEQGQSEHMQMAPSGQLGILDRLMGEQKVKSGGGDKRKLRMEIQGPSDHVKVKKKKEDDNEGTDEVTKALVFNFMNSVAPSLAQEFQQSFNFTKSTLHLQDVLEVVGLIKLGPETRNQEATVKTLSADELKALVLKFIAREAPGLVKEFIERFDPGETGLELEEVLRGYQGKRKPKPGNTEQEVKASVVKHVGKTINKNSSIKEEIPKASRKIGATKRIYTEEEDTVIKAAMEEAGEGTIDFKAIARHLNRTLGSVRSRVSILGSGSGRGVKKPFTLLEDVILLEELIIPRLGGDKLSELKLKSCDFAELTERFGKSERAACQRWERILQPWLLQHYSGTLGLRVEIVLSEYIADNYTNFSDINWAHVAANQEFVGHIGNSLRQLYLSHLKRPTQLKLSLDLSEVTVGHIAEYCRNVYGDGKGRPNRVKEERQRQVIDFFQAKVEELGIRDFV